MSDWPAWFPFVLFMGWSVVYHTSAWAKYRRYRKYQRDQWLAAEAAKHLVMSIAFFMGALIVAPRPVLDFRVLISYGRAVWLAAFFPALIAVILDLRSQARIERVRQRQERWEG